MNKAAGAGLRLLREDAGMSRKVLAAHLGVTTIVLREYERGRVSIPAARLFYADKLFRAGHDFYISRIVARCFSAIRWKMSSVFPPLLS